MTTERFPSKECSPATMLLEHLNIQPALRLRHSDTVTNHKSSVNTVIHAPVRKDYSVCTGKRITALGALQHRRNRTLCQRRRPPAPPWWKAGIPAWDTVSAPASTYMATNPAHTAFLHFTILEYDRHPYSSTLQTDP
jgi:hypothetical protein